MKTSKRPVFKLNTSELPKDYKQPIKPKKRKGHRGPRRIVRSRRRNEFIPEGADWCEINGAKLRQDIFFGEKRGRKFIPDGPLNFFVPSGDGSATTEILEAPYGDGGDGGSCGCACEGCVCGEGEGCACSGPGTDDGGGFSQGAQDGQQGQQGGPEAGPETGPDTTGSNFGSNLGDVFGPETGPDTTGNFGSNLGDVFGPEGTFGPDTTGSNFGSNLGDVFGPDTSSNFGSNLGDVFGPDTSSNFGSNLGDVFGPEGTFGPDTSNFGQNLGDVFGPENFGQNLGFDPTGPSYNFTDDQGRSFTANPDLITDPGMLSARDGQINSALAPGERGPSAVEVQQGLMANPLDPESIMGMNPKGIDLQTINVAPLDIGFPTNQSRGIDPNDLPTVDPDMGLGKGFITDPTSVQQAPDAKGAIPATPDDVKGVIDAIINGINTGQIGRAGAETFGKDQTQFPGVSNPLSNPDPSQGNLNAAFQAAQNMNTQQAQSNPGLMSALESFASGKGGLPGLAVEPEAPGRTMDAPHNQPSISEFWGEPITDPGRTMDAPHDQPSMQSLFDAREAELADRGPTLSNPFADDPEQPAQNQPSIEEFWGEKGPGVPSLTNPFADNPDILDAPGWYTGQQAPGWFTGEFGNQTMGRDAPTNFGNPAAPTAEQMQAAKDAMTELAGREQSQNPLTDLFGRDVTNPDIFAPTGRDPVQEADKGRTMDQPHNFPSLEELFSAREQELTDKGRTLDEPHTLPSLQELFDAREQQLSERDFTAKELQQERQSEREQQARDRDLEKQEQRAFERAQERTSVPSRDPAPTRGQERGSRGQERGTPAPSRGAPSLGRGPGLTNFGPNLGRDAPGVQGLPAGLRGNDLAQALVGRGFDPNLVGAALTINDHGQMLASMLEAAGLSHAQAVATAAAARGAVEAQFGLPGNRR